MNNFVWNLNVEREREGEGDNGCPRKIERAWCVRV
jgi:hypothetical protein